MSDIATRLRADWYGKPSDMVLDYVLEEAADEIDRLRAALDRITKHPDCSRLVMQIACEALEGREG